MILAVVAVLIIVGAGAGAAVLMGNGGNSNPGQTTIKQKGSDTMLELAQIWAERYHENNTNVSIEVSGGGSGVGIQEFIKKSIDIAQASRQMKATEIQQAKDAGLNPVEFKVAVDGVAIIVHQNNPINNLTIGQLRGIYNGTYTNWNQVGGPDKAIVTFGRQSTSGTYQYFQEVVLKNGAYVSTMNQMTGNAAIVSGVQGDDRAIGYVGIGYAKESSGISVLQLKHNATSPVYTPLNQIQVLTGKYELARYLYFYTNGVPNGGARDYLLWVLGTSAGQTAAVHAGFYALAWYDQIDMRAKLGAVPGMTVKEKGSDTMLELAQLWSERFHENKSYVNVEISGGGSGVGIQEFINKNVDICQASRAIKPSEVQQSIAAGLNPTEFKVAIDGIAIIVHQNNPINNLTIGQLRGIYNGTYTNWNQVGGPDKAIVTFGRQSTSGTYQYFQEVVLKNGAYIPSMQQMTGNAAIISGVQGDDRAIGYVGIGYAKESSGISVLQLKHNATSTAYAPTDKSAVLSGQYELSRPLYLYTNGVQQDEVWIWLNWILDANAGQKVAEQAGFYALPQDMLELQRAKLVL